MTYLPPEAGIDNPVGNGGSFEPALGERPTTLEQVDKYLASSAVMPGEPSLLICTVIYA